MIDTVLEFTFDFISLIPKTVKFLSLYFKGRHLKHLILSSKVSKTVSLSIPIFDCQIINGSKNVVIYDEMLLLLQIQQLLIQPGIKEFSVSNGLDTEDNEIIIGGPVSNKRANAIVKKYFRNFKCLVTEEHYARYKSYANLANMDYDFIEICAQSQEGFLINGKHYKYIHDEQGWAIVAKLIDNSSNVNHTITLLFGCGGNGTLGAVQYFTSHYTKIHKLYKDKPYFGIIKVDKGGNSAVSSISWLDLDDVLKNKGVIK